MRKQLKWVSLLMILILATGIFAGCSDNTSVKSTETTSSNAESKTYRLGISAYPAFYTWYISQAEGYFKANGVNVELVYFPVYSDSVQAFSSGQLDMLSLAMPDVIAPYINGIDLEAVLVLDNSNGADGLVSNKDITSIEQLKGKSIATEYGTIEHFFLLTALQKAGLTEKDINFVNLSISDSAPAFLAGKVDAACLWEPSLSMALGKKGSNLLTSSADTPGLIPDVLIANGDMIKNGKEDIEKVINAYYDAMEFYVNNKDKAIADMALGAEITEDEMRVSMSGSKLFTLEEGIASMDKKSDDYSYLPYTTQKIAEFLKGVNMIDKLPEDTSKMVNSTYMQNVLKKRGSSVVPDTKL